MMTGVSRPDTAMPERRAVVYALMDDEAMDYLEAGGGREWTR